VLDAIHREDHPAVTAARAQSLATCQLLEVSYRLRRADGVYRRVVGRGAPVRDADGQVLEWVGTVTDVEDQRRAEEQLRQAQQLQAVGTLAGGVAHEVNNQMTAVLGFGAFLLRDLGPEHPQASDVRQIVRAGQRAAQVTEQLLTFSRRQVTQPETHDLHQLVIDMVPVLRRILGSDKTLVIAPNRPVHQVLVDPRQIEQILINLAANGRDAMGTDGCLTISLEDTQLDAAYFDRHGGVRIEPGRYVLLAVSDTGAGMDRDTLARVFEPFFTTKPVGEGTGLGLSMVYGVVKKHGGCVWIYSEPGRGTTVKVYLPVAAPTSLIPPHQDAPPPPSRPAAVLLVEDDPLVRGMARRALEAAGHQVREAADGAEALDLATGKGGLPELLVTDLIMPRMNGRELADALARHHPHLPVIYMSGYTGYDAPVRGLLPPGAPFVQKPFTPDQLVDAVASLLQSVRSTRPQE
jgi:signal transduction histidine kinase/CheY-like chemotaxis protein